MKKIVLLSLSLFVGVLLNAQIQNGINYQAAARDNAGNILSNQAVAFRLAILQGSSSGTTVYQETHSVITNTLGLVNLVIGTGAVNAGVYQSINWANGPYFLQVEMAVGAGSFTLMGTSQFVSVPYALYAQHSGDKSLPGRGITISNDSIHSSWTNYGNDVVANNSGNVGIGTAPNFQKLEVNGGVGIGNTSTSSPGAMRFTGADFEGYTGASWKSFTKTSIDYFQYDNSVNQTTFTSTLRNAMVLSVDSLIVPQSGNYLIICTGRGFNSSTYAASSGIYDYEGDAGVINTSVSMNWVGGISNLMFTKYTVNAAGTTYYSYISQTFNLSTYSYLTAGNVLKVGAAVQSTGTAPTGNWTVMPYKIQLVRLN